MNNALVVPLGFDEASIITQKNRDSYPAECGPFIQLAAGIKFFHCKFIHIRSLLLTLLPCVLVSLSLGASGSIAAEQSGNSPIKLDRLASASQFAASSKRVAFPVQASNGTVAIYLANHDQTSASKLISERSHLLWPYLSIDGLRLIVVRQFFDGVIYELLSCELDAFNCKVLVRSDRRISSPFELSKGVVLYSASPHAVRMNGRGAYDRNDFWIVDGTGEPRQLTDFQFYELGSISASPGQVYFSAIGPRKDKPILPSMQPLARENSDIFRLPFDSEQLKVAVPDQV